MGYKIRLTRKYWAKLADSIQHSRTHTEFSVRTISRIRRSKGKRLYPLLVSSQMSAHTSRVNGLRRCSQDVGHASDRTSADHVLLKHLPAT